MEQLQQMEQVEQMDVTVQMNLDQMNLLIVPQSVAEFRLCCLAESDMFQFLSEKLVLYPLDKSPPILESIISKSEQFDIPCYTTAKSIIYLQPVADLDNITG